MQTASVISLQVVTIPKTSSVHHIRSRKLEIVKKRDKISSNQQFRHKKLIMYVRYLVELAILLVRRSRRFICEIHESSKSEAVLSVMSSIIGLRIGRIRSIIVLKTWSNCLPEFVFKIVPMFCPPAFVMKIASELIRSLSHLCVEGTVPRSKSAS